MAHSPASVRTFAFGCMAAVSIGLCAIATTVRAAASRDVDAAIDKAITFLHSQQQLDGSWETGVKPGPAIFGADPKIWLGFGAETAAATYALLLAGESPYSAPMHKAVEWLESNDAHGTYVIGLRACVWSLLPQQWRSKDTRFSMVRDHDRDFALYSRIQRGPNLGFYGYVYGVNVPAFGPYDPNGPPVGSSYDRSNSQYGVFAAWGTEQAGTEIPLQYWLDEDAAWKRAQRRDGGWDYNDLNAQRSTFTMTCAGVATLFITQNYVLRSNTHQFDKCTGGFSDPVIDKGLEWIDKHYAASRAGAGRLAHYGAHDIGRVGIASGRKYFGDIDWYKAGSDDLIRTQAANGSWGTIHDTCFAIAFLCRGGAPVIINKLEYETTDASQTRPWNERPRDAANMTAWISKHLCQAFCNWQIVNLRTHPEDLHDAPILYIAGSTPLNLTPEDIEKLRQYIEQGGLVLGNADGGSVGFSSSFRKLGATMFPMYEFRKVIPSHPMFGNWNRGNKWKSTPQVESISNGVRELMLLIPQADVGRSWQTESFKTREEAFELGGNIFVYASGKECLPPTRESYLVTPDAQSARSIELARLQIGENWNPEAGGWPRLSAIMHNKFHVDIKIHRVKLASGDLAKSRIAHWTGTTRIVLSDAQRQELKNFVDHGGTLIVDSAGGSIEFSDSVETELRQIFGEAAARALITPLPASHPIFADPKWKIDEIKYRRFARRSVAGEMDKPRIRGIAVADGRIGVFYSREDLSAGLVGHEVDGIVGYAPEIATQLMSNMILYADAVARK